VLKFGKEQLDVVVSGIKYLLVLVKRIKGFGKKT
jgi:hypothetical protein